MSCHVWLPRAVPVLGWVGCWGGIARSHSFQPRLALKVAPSPPQSSSQLLAANFSAQMRVVARTCLAEYKLQSTRHTMQPNCTHSYPRIPEATCCRPRQSLTPTLSSLQTPGLTRDLETKGPPWQPIFKCLAPQTRGTKLVRACLGVSLCSVF